VASAAVGVGTVAAEAGTATAGGSALTTFATWVAGTVAGKAAVAAVVVGGTAVGIGVVDAPDHLGPAPAVAESDATGRLLGPGDTRAGGGSAAPSGDPARTAPPGRTRPTAAGPPGVSGAPGDPGASRSAPAKSRGGGARGGSGAPDPSDPSASPVSGSGPSDLVAPAGPPSLSAGPAVQAAALRPGRNGEIIVPVTNYGTGPATNLVATVTLPAGITVRGGQDEENWTCSGWDTFATCPLTTLPAATTGTVRVKVRVADDAVGGPVAGTVTADGNQLTIIPVTAVEVLPS
jgi:uncharacterized repeat protein (TIGR01451 family)